MTANFMSQIFLDGTEGNGRVEFVRRRRVYPPIPNLSLIGGKFFEQPSAAQVPGPDLFVVLSVLYYNRPKSAFLPTKKSWVIATLFFNGIRTY